MNRIMPSALHCALSVALLLLLWTPTKVMAEWSSQTFDDGKVKVIFSSFLDDVPQVGMWPVTVKISNSSTTRRSITAHINVTRGYWSIQSDLRRTLQVEPLGSATYELMVPIPTYAVATDSDNGGVLPRGTVRVENFGDLAAQDSTSLDSKAWSLSFSPYLLVTSSWAAGRGALQDQFEKSSRLFFGTYIDSTLDFPRDWRALSGVHTAYVGHREWSTLDTAQRATLRSWVATGGNLIFPSTGQGIPIELRGTTVATELLLGYGSVRTSSSGEVLEVPLSPNRLSGFQQSVKGVPNLALASAEVQPRDKPLGIVVMVIADYGAGLMLVIRRRWPANNTAIDHNSPYRSARQCARNPKTMPNPDLNGQT